MFKSALVRPTLPVTDQPFAGVPFLLKDLVAWYTGEPTNSAAAGSDRRMVPTA